MEGDDRAALVAYRLDEADEALAAARLSLDHGLYRSAVNRAYYAVFYAASAVLIREGPQFAKHSGVQGDLHRHLVHSGRIEREWGAVYTRLFEERLRGDYREGVEFELDEATSLVDGAAGFVGRMKDLLLNAGEGGS